MGKPYEIDDAQQPLLPSPATQPHSRTRHWRTALVSVGALAALSLTASSPALAGWAFCPFSGTSELDSWVAFQHSVAWQQLERNIHPEGTMPGALVASPSTDKPDYFFQWTRDAALSIRPIVNAYVSGDDSFADVVNDYIAAADKMQHAQTSIGGFYDGGLGDAKYKVDGEPFMQPWGRPQLDGPASRVSTLTRVANYLLDQTRPASDSFVHRELYDGQLPTTSIIKGDLEYLSHWWPSASFDLWEEVYGAHFYTLSVIRKALRDGARLAERLGDEGAARWYATQANAIAHRLEEFWDEDLGIIRVTVNHTQRFAAQDITLGKTSQLDAAVFLAALHTDDTELMVSDKLISTLDKYESAMLSAYPLNRGRSVPAVGRYPEDVYDGVGVSIANPWFIACSAVSELLFRAADALATMDPWAVITPRSRAFYERVTGGPLNGSRSAVRQTLTTSLRRRGDDYVGLIREFAMRNGSLHEQFDRTSGRGRGARDLSWSYAAFITQTQARRSLAHQQF